LADLGESLFQSKGCIGCHTIGSGRLTGPDLMGVTERREFGWMVAMITNPDSMVKEDSVARRLLTEYMTPMLNMGVTADDAKAIYEYLRGNAQ
jgi:cytochrome c2